MEERIKRKETKQKERTAKKKLLKEQANKANVATNNISPDNPVVPVDKIIQPDTTPAQLRPYGWQPGVSGNPSGRPKSKPVRDSLEKVWMAASTGADKTQIERAMRLVKDKIISFLQDDELEVDELHIVIQDLEMLATRWEGKPAQEIDDSGSGKTGLTININATRFAVPPAVEKGDVIEVDCVHGS
jgi:hypothetical protein